MRREASKGASLNFSGQVISQTMNQRLLELLERKLG